MGLKPSCNCVKPNKFSEDKTLDMAQQNKYSYNSISNTSNSLKHILLCTKLLISSMDLNYYRKDHDNHNKMKLS